MQTLQFHCITWQRPDANGLFDYQQKNHSHPIELVVQESGDLYRKQSEQASDNNQFSMFFVSKKCKAMPTPNDKCRPILKIIKKQTHFIIKSYQIFNQPLCKIIPCKNQGFHLLSKQDILRFGKVEAKILSMGFTKKKFKSKYEQIKSQIQESSMSKITQITASFYEANGSQSLVQDNPTCRYCHSKTCSVENPFLISCKCDGHSKYVHQQCLLGWVTKRGQLSQIKDKGILYAQARMFKCELCNQFFDVPEMFRKIYRYQTASLKISMQPISDEILIIFFKYQADSIYFIDLKRRDLDGENGLIIGRSLQSDIVLNELSVSRKHAFLKIDYQNKRIILSDNSSKFGTLNLIKHTQIQNNQTYQVGRSLITFKKNQKKSFLQKIGILCFVSQKLGKERRKKSMELQQNKKQNK